MIADCIGAWTAMRRTKRNRNDYERGFAWALGRYFGGHMCPLEIESNISNIDRGPFDAGIEEALRVIRTFGFNEQEIYPLHTPAATRYACVYANNEKGTQ